MTPIMDRGRYHHGDLRNALAAAALVLARNGGPEAVVLREVARQVGVSATAAYRHFANQRDLLAAVRSRAVESLANAMVAAVEGCAGPAAPAASAGADPGEYALARLRSATHAYLRFAADEPGLFSAAFFALERDLLGGRAPAGRLDFFQTEAFTILAHLLDDLVDAGRVPPQQRRHAEYALWSAMHGIAVTTLDSALRFLPADERASAVDQAVENTIRGLTR